MRSSLLIAEITKKHGHKLAPAVSEESATLWAEFKSIADRYRPDPDLEQEEVLQMHRWPARSR